MSRILVIDDEELIIEALQAILEDLGHRVTGCSNSEDGIREALEHTYDLIITDLRMPGKSGLDVTKEILSIKPDADILVVTAYPTDPLAGKTLEAGARALTKKPFEIAKILEVLQDNL